MYACMHASKEIHIQARNTNNKYTDMHKERMKYRPNIEANTQHEIWIDRKKE